MTEYGEVNHDELKRHGDGEYEPHRPPKYVEGIYKPWYINPEYRYAVYVYPLDMSDTPYLAKVDSDGDAEGVVRDAYTMQPLSEGGITVVGAVDTDGEIQINDLYDERIDREDVVELIDEYESDSP